LKDLVVLAADRSIEAAIRGLLGRPKAIGIRPIDFETFSHPRRDPGCYHQAHEFLGSLLGQYEHALVIFDRVWAGSPIFPVADLEDHVRALLDSKGWRERSDVVVIDPELEVWVWSDSPKVDEVLQWTGRRPPLRKWVHDRGLWPSGHAKPSDPKQAVELALREVGMALSSSIYLKLAKSVSVYRCTDPAFGRLRNRLQAWFQG
jgi:hypothetical protein